MCCFWDYDRAKWINDNDEELDLEELKGIGEKTMELKTQLRQIGIQLNHFNELH